MKCNKRGVIKSSIRGGGGVKGKCSKGECIKKGVH